MTDLQELYQSVILDHNRKPRNFGELAGANREADGKNPLCGDEVHVALVLQDDTITDVRFTGHGCAISKASASLMTAAVKGKPVADVRALVHRFKEMMSIEESAEESPAPVGSMGDMEALRGVVKYPVRIKCAVLGWNTLLEALGGDS